MNKEYLDLVNEKILSLYAEKIYARTRQIVPVDTGKLRDSAYIKQISKYIWEIGYTANYAVYVHEIEYNRHEKGKQYKFLEDAALEIAALSGSIFNIGIEYNPLKIQIGYGMVSGGLLYKARNRVG